MKTCKTGCGKIKAGGSIKKYQDGGDTTVSVKKVSVNDPYEASKRKLAIDKLNAVKKKDLALASAKLKLNKTAKMKSGGPVKKVKKMAKGGAADANFGYPLNGLPMRPTNGNTDISKNQMGTNPTMKKGGVIKRKGGSVKKK
jgi:hypothetical protein